MKTNLNYVIDFALLHNHKETCDTMCQIKS